MTKDQIWEPVLRNRLDEIAEKHDAVVDVNGTCVNVGLTDGSFICTPCTNALNENLQLCIQWLTQRDHPADSTDGIELDMTEYDLADTIKDVKICEGVITGRVPSDNVYRVDPEVK